MVEQKQEAAQWLGELIQDGFYDKLVIIGFPYDEGAKKAGARSGSDYGPGKSLKLASLLLTTCVL